MKKLESTWYNMAIVLTLISIIAGAALAYVNSLTVGPIKEIQQKNEKEAIAAVLGGGDIEIQNIDTVEYSGAQYIVTSAGDAGTAVKAVDPLNASFGGGLTIMVGFDANGVIKGYRVLVSNETPGLGAKAAEWFQEGGKGCIVGHDMTKYENGLFVTKDKGDHADADVDAITASTITSRSFLRAVNAAYQAYLTTCGNEPSYDVNSGATQQAHE